MVEKILIFIIFLGPLIFFHELGHYLFARFFGVKVETFSIGFGPKLWKFRKWNTEFTISLIPLGGYVKMFGDDPFQKDQIPLELRSEAFNYKGKWARFWIVFGGPLANFLMAFAIFYILLVTGEKVPEAKIGMLPQQSVLYQKGLRLGDILLKINDQDMSGLAELGPDEGVVQNVTIERKLNGENGEKSVFKYPISLSFQEFFKELTKYPPRFRAPMVVDQKQNQYVLAVKPKNVNWSMSLEEMAQGKFKEVYLYRFGGELNLEENRFPVVDVGSEIKLDLTKYLNEQSNGINSPLESAKELATKSSNSEQQITNPNEIPALLTPEVKGFFLALTQNGLYPQDLIVDDLMDQSSAMKAGLKPRDIIINFNGENIYSFEDLREKIQVMKTGHSGMLGVIRSTEKQFFRVFPDPEEVQKIGQVRIGIFSAGVFAPISYTITMSQGIFESIGGAFVRTWQTMKKTVAGFKKLITNEVPLQSVGGPLAIGKVASDSFSISLSYFFKLMAIISVNLGIINLFPIPVLDGGHILFIIFELFNRGPLSQKKIELAQQFGVSLLFLLIFAALFNDVTRLLSS